MLFVLTPKVGVLTGARARRFLRMSIAPSECRRFSPWADDGRFLTLLEPGTLGRFAFASGGALVLSRMVVSEPIARTGWDCLP